MSLDLLNFSLDQFQLYLLVAFRLTGLILTAPFFGNAAFPPQIKIGLAMFIALILFPVLPSDPQTIPQHLGAYVVLVMAELAMGMMIGFFASLIFVGIQLGGHLVSQQMGITIAEVIDPISNTSLSVISQYQALFCSLLFMVLGGPNILLGLFFKSFLLVPIGGVMPDPGLTDFIAIKSELYIFHLAIKSGAPIMVALLIATVAMGFIARTVPEMNIFIIGFSIRLGMGMLILWVSIDMFSYIFQVYMDDMFRELNGILPLLG